MPSTRLEEYIASPDNSARNSERFADSEEARPLSDIIEETKVNVEYLSEGGIRIPFLGTIVWWQPRHFFAEADGISYQPTLEDGTPTGTVTKVPFCKTEAIKALDDAEFAIVCEKREYVFKAEDQNECDKIVKNLLELRGRELPMSPITPH